MNKENVVHIYNKTQLIHEDEILSFGTTWIEPEVNRIFFCFRNLCKGIKSHVFQAMLKNKMMIPTLSSFLPLLPAFSSFLSFLLIFADTFWIYFVTIILTFHSIRSWIVSRKSTVHQEYSSELEPTIKSQRSHLEFIILKGKNWAQKHRYDTISLMWDL